MLPQILSTGSGIPGKRVSNDDLAQSLDTNDEWIFSHTGIKARHIALPEEKTSDFALQAAEQALMNAGIKPEELDLILVATGSGDYEGFPATACIVQEKLGAIKAGAMDVAAACSGFTYALETARCFIAAGTAKYVLVIGAEVFSRILDWTDRSTCVLFGDGAGAVLLGPAKNNKSDFYPSLLRSEGSGAKTLMRRADFVFMDGRAVYTFAIRVVPQIIREILASQRLTLDQVSWIVPHQANARIIESAAKRLGFPLEKWYLNMQEYANTSAASIPLALAEMNDKGLLKPGDLIVTVGFGAGLTYGANLFRW